MQRDRLPELGRFSSGSWLFSLLATMQEAAGVLKEGFLVKRLCPPSPRCQSFLYPVLRLLAVSLHRLWKCKSAPRTTKLDLTPSDRTEPVRASPLRLFSYSRPKDSRRLFTEGEEEGHVVRNWKVRWFVLLQDKLLYYKIEGGKKEPYPKGRIILDGCTITCPCLEYENRPLLIKLKTKTNTDYFLECCSREERDSWALDITGAIHAGHPVQVEELHKMKNSFKLLESISLHHIVEKMCDSSAGIKLTHNLEQGNRYKETFTGSALVDWLISNSFAVSRFEAVTLASMLMEENFIKPVGARSTEAMRYGDLSEQFLDDSTALYMFAESSNKNINSREELQFNSAELSGTIVKQGFLVKQGHKRKNWKVRKFVLRAEPAFLHYYDPTKEENKPVGGFSLRGCLVSALEDNGVPAGVKGNVQGNLFKIITKNDIHYYIQASSKAERTQWIEAIKPLT